LAFVLLSLAFCFTFYQKFSSRKTNINHYIAPLFIWIILNLIISLKLKGAGFLIIPVFSGLLMLASFIITQKSNWKLNLLLSIPTLLLIAPFIQMFPIGLGLKVLFGSAILTVLAFGLLLPVFGSYSRKGSWSLFFLILAISFFVKAHFNSDYELGKAKSNSLLYVLDVDKNKAVWTTYDTNLDEWTQTYLGTNPEKAKDLNANPLKSKYNSGFTFMAEAPIINLARPSVEFIKDSIAGGNRYLKIKITPNRKVNRYDIFANDYLVFQNFKANGLSVLGQKGITYERRGKKILSYYVVDNLPLEMEFSIQASKILDMDLMESSYDLLTDPKFSIRKRADWMMPTPFVSNDAVVLKQKIKPNLKLVSEKAVTYQTKYKLKKAPLIIVSDTLKKQ
jgi:hypothetical protein